MLIDHAGKRPTIDPTDIGEVVYRGEVHHGEHEPILDFALFEAVQAKLAAPAVARAVAGFSPLRTRPVYTPA
jgi:hypothetical protein